jgi:hypothetical protein
MKWAKASVSRAVLVGEDVAPVAMSTTEWWMCMAEPGSSSIGLAMKVAKQSWRSAASRIRRLK